MKKLGKKLHNTSETVEAYCMSCSHCGCNCSCPVCGSYPYSTSDAIWVSNNQTANNINSLTSNGYNAQLG